jgi:hypothetical protein
MGRFSGPYQDIFSVFGSAAWEAEDIPTFPQNFIGTVPDKKYIRVTPVFDGNSINVKSASGILMIDIFTPAGTGPSDTSTIADTLDSYLVGKSKDVSTGVTQFGISSLSPFGLDKDNPSLYRSTYSIPFSFFGV